MAGKPNSQRPAASRRTKQAMAVALGGVAAAGAAADQAAAMLPASDGGGPPPKTTSDGPAKSGHPSQGQTQAPAPKTDPKPAPTQLERPTQFKPKVTPPAPTPVRARPPQHQEPRPHPANPTIDKPKVDPPDATPPKPRTARPRTDPGPSHPTRPANSRTDAGQGDGTHPANPTINKPKVTPPDATAPKPRPAQPANFRTDAGQGDGTHPANPTINKPKVTPPDATAPKPRPARPANFRTDAGQGDGTHPANPTIAKPKVTPAGTDAPANSRTDAGQGDGTQPDARPDGPTPTQRENALSYAQTLDRIDENGGALNQGLANSLHEYGNDPTVVRLAKRIRDAAAKRKRVYDDGGIVRDTTPGGPRLQRNDDDPTQVRDFRRNYPHASVDDVTSDGNHKIGGVHDGHGGILGIGGGDPVDGVDVKDGYTWEDTGDYNDDDVPYWLPQGLDGRGNKQVVAWYSKESEGGPDSHGRVSFVDKDKGTYRNALLVDPTGGADYDPVKTHAGGVVWQKNYMYVADTDGGVKVFDTDKMVHSNGEKQSGNYKYLLPKVGSYDNVGGPMKFSSLSVDRSKPGKPALVVTEYRNDDDPDTAGDTHIVRWEIGKDGRLKDELPSAKYVTKRDQMQGGAIDHGKVYLSSSDPGGSGGALYSGKPGHGLKEHPWGDSPESLYVHKGLLWSLSEEAGHRAVYGSPLDEN